MPFQVRDNRGGNWFWLHNIIIDHYGPELGPYGIAVYTALCRYAGNEQQTWVNQRTLQVHTATSERKIRDVLRQLETLGLLVSEEQSDEHGRLANIYHLALPPATADASPPASGAPAPASSAAPPGTERRTLQFMKKTHEQRGSVPREPMNQAASPDALANGVVHEQIDIWGVVLTDLAEQIVPANYERWLARTSLLSHAAGAAVVGVPDQICADQLARRFDPLVRRALADALGEEVAVRYEVVGS